MEHLGTGGEHNIWGDRLLLHISQAVSIVGLMLYLNSCLQSRVFHLQPSVCRLQDIHSLLQFRLFCVFLLQEFHSLGKIFVTCLKHRQSPLHLYVEYLVGFLGSAFAGSGML